MKPIVLVGEARGEAEQRLNSSFVGPSGIELIRMLGEADAIKLTSFDRNYITRYFETQDPTCVEAIWSLHPEVYRTNVFQLHPHGNDLVTLCGPREDGIPGYPVLAKSRYVRAEYECELNRLASEILAIDPNLVVCLGNTPLWALAGRTGITKWRGTTLLSTHCVADYKLLPTYHPAAVLRQWDIRPTVVADLMKAVREAQYPEIRRPQREIWIEPDVADIDRFCQQHVYQANCRLLSVDIETSGTRITCIGLAPSSKLALVVPFDDERAKGGSYWATRRDEAAAWRIIIHVLGDVSIPKLFQNGLYDIAFLWRSMRIKVFGAEEDTMLLSHALQPEALKRLDFLGSIWSDEGAWKAEFRQRKTIKRDA